MNIWLRRYIGFTGVAGGGLGLVALTPYVTEYHDIFTSLIVISGTIYFAWLMVIAGLVFEGKQSKPILFQVLIAQIIQIPAITLPFFAYIISSGFYFGFKWTFPLHFGVSFNVLTTSFHLNFLGNHEQMIFGVNVAALVTAVLIWRSLKTMDTENKPDWLPEHNQELE